ncbi:hypothetical protein BZG36_00240 [Bifiguratus adelaidae]|uniref:Uncharacterized protein n=1 Tax=Bifiguratus adelaidae TaxID=1938954 RepID=A0A261Y8L8_9FUNG|nr:hypothetical protein BZG36_00240 [Bifiguratus adelaidae]
MPIASPAVYDTPSPLTDTESPIGKEGHYRDAVSRNGTRRQESPTAKEAHTLPVSEATHVTREKVQQANSQGSAELSTSSLMGDKVQELASTFRVRLEFARWKVAHGWVNRSIQELETILPTHERRLSMVEMPTTTSKSLTQHLDAKLDRTRRTPEPRERYMDATYSAPPYFPQMPRSPVRSVSKAKRNLEDDSDSDTLEAAFSAPRSFNRVKGRDQAWHKEDLLDDPDHNPFSASDAFEGHGRPLDDDEAQAAHTIMMLSSPHHHSRPSTPQRRHFPTSYGDARRDHGTPSKRSRRWHGSDFRRPSKEWKKTGPLKSVSPMELFIDGQNARQQLKLGQPVSPTRHAEGGRTVFTWQHQPKLHEHSGAPGVASALARVPERANSPSLEADLRRHRNHKRRSSVSKTSYHTIAPRPLAESPVENAKPSRKDSAGGGLRWKYVEPTTFGPPGTKEKLPSIPSGDSGGSKEQTLSASPRSPQATYVPLPVQEAPSNEETRDVDISSRSRASRPSPISVPSYAYGSSPHVQPTSGSGDDANSTHLLTPVTPTRSDILHHPMTVETLSPAQQQLLSQLPDSVKPIPPPIIRPADANSPTQKRRPSSPTPYAVGNGSHIPSTRRQHNEFRITQFAPQGVNDQFRITEFVSVNGAAVNKTPGARGKNSIGAVARKDKEPEREGAREKL